MDAKVFENLRVFYVCEIYNYLFVTTTQHDFFYNVMGIKNITIKRLMESYCTI